MKQFLQKLTAMFLMFATCNALSVGPISGGSGGGSGDVVGPASSTDNAIVRYDGTTGKLLQNSSITVTDDGYIYAPNGASATPSYSFANNTDTGLFYTTTGATYIGVSIDNSTKAAFLSTGEFYLGALSGTGKLSIQGNGTTTGKAFAVANSSGTTTAYIQDDGSISAGASTSSGTMSYAFGNNNTASGVRSVAMGDGNVSNASTAMCFGSSNTSSGIAAICFGDNNTSSATLAVSHGFRVVASRRAQRSFSGDGYFGANGTAQGIEVTLQVKTTNNTATTLWLNGASQGSNVRFNLQSGYVVSGVLTVHGVKSDGSAVAMFVRQISYKNVGGTSSEVFAPVTIGTDNASGCALSFLNPDTNDAIEPQVTGITAETWRWTATFYGVETAYGN